MGEREENLFYKLTSDNENATTELLCNLCKFDIYREYILNKLKLDNNLISYNDIDTQYKIPGKRKKPDIVIENIKMKIFIENKVSKYRRIELSQLNTYPEHLNEIKNKKVKLIFLIPNGYKYEYKIKDVKKKYKFIAIIYWDDLLEDLRYKNKIICSEILTESISFFEKILNTMQEIQFDQEEINLMSNIKKLVMESTAIGKCLDIFYDIICQLKEKPNLHFKKRENPWPEVSKNGIGYWFYQENCYIGYSFGAIDDKQLKDYVLSLTIYESVVSKVKIKKISKNTYGFDGEYYYFKFEERYLQNGKELLQFCEKIMKNVLKNVN
jgi:hypothetical protein